MVQWEVLPPDPQAKPPRPRTEYKSQSFILVPCVRDGKAQLLKLRVGSKRRMSDTRRLVWATALDKPVVIPPAAVGDAVLNNNSVVPGCVYAVEGKRGDADRHLLRIGSRDGEVTWRMPLSPEASGHMAAERERFLLWTEADELTLCHASGSAPPDRLWSVEVGAGTYAPLLWGDLVYAATDERLVALDAVSGTPLWRVPFEGCGKPVAAPVRMGQTILLATDKGLYARRPTDGSVVWKADVGPLTAPPAVDYDKVAVTTRDGRLLVFGREDIETAAAARRLLASHWPAVRAVPGLAEHMMLEQFMLDNVPPLGWYDGANANAAPLVGSGRVVFAARNLMVINELAQASERRWAAINWLGSVTTPIVSMETGAYFGTEKGGVVCVKSRR
jgi:hypothetical protein